MESVEMWTTKALVGAFLRVSSNYTKQQGPSVSWLSCVLGLKNFWCSFYKCWKLFVSVHKVKMSFSVNRLHRRCYTYERFSNLSVRYECYLKYHFDHLFWTVAYSFCVSSIGTLIKYKDSLFIHCCILFLFMWSPRCSFCKIKLSKHDKIFFKK